MSEQETAPPFLRIVRGEPTAEEIAALVAVLTAAAGSRPAAVPVPGYGWAARSSLLRPTVSPGHGGWRASALSR